jgi:peroxiredoxin (alkyl hydroperoxide reductase subunit C)
MNISCKALVLTLAAILFGGVALTDRAGAAPPPCGLEPCAMHRLDLAGCQSVAKVGEPAPDFTLDAVVGKEFKKINLADYRGKWVILFFYPLDFTFVCPTEIKGFNEHLKEFQKFNAVVLGASVDSKWSHKAWIERGDLGSLQFPLLSDFNKKTARRYGILDERDGVALRGLFIIDDKGTLQYESVNNLSVGRSIDETLRILEALQTGELCPINWKPGQKTLGK